MGGFMNFLCRFIVAAVLMTGLCAGCSDDKKKSVQELNTKAMTLLQQNQVSKALKTITLAVERAEAEYGPDHLETAKSLETLALIHQAGREYEKAEDAAKRALAIITSASGEDSVDAAKAMNALAGLYYAQKKYPEAMDYFKQALAVVEKRVPADDPSLEILKTNIETCEAQQKGEPLPGLAEQSAPGIPDLVPQPVKQAMLDQFAKQNIFIVNLQPQPPIQMGEKGMILPYHALKTDKDGASAQEVVVLFASISNPEKTGTYIFQQCRLISYRSYLETLSEGGIEKLKKELVEVFPALYS
jgi:tetratricopeptide (TPR) repeat protein